MKAKLAAKLVAFVLLMAIAIILPVPSTWKGVVAGSILVVVLFIIAYSLYAEEKNE